MSDTRPLSARVRGRIADLPLVRAAWRVWHRPREARAAGTPIVREADVRLLIGPANSAGQGYAWARSAEKLDGVAATSFMHRADDDRFSFPADHIVRTPVFVTNAPWQRAQRKAVLGQYTHVLLESGRPLWGHRVSVQQQVDDLNAAGIAVALLWHGSDIRVPSVHAQTDPDSPFRLKRYRETARLEEITRSNREFMATAGAPVFVSTPDLLAYAPGASWLPVVVDIEQWRGVADRPALTGSRPLTVVHVPSNAGLKGSELIAATLRALDDEGVISYRDVRGVPADRMPAIYGSADVVLDQFVLGTYGVAACEAMACGRLVVSHVSDEVRRIVLERTGRELPVVEARASELESMLRAIAADREGFSAIARRGPEFVEAVHDGRRSAAELARFLASTASPGAITAMGESTDA